MGTGLLYMIAQNVTQCSVQQVRCRVVCSSHIADRRNNHCVYTVTSIELTLNDRNRMQIDTILFFHAVHTCNAALLIVNESGIADLSAAFGVEWCLIKYKDTLVPFCCFCKLSKSIITDICKDGILAEGFVTGKFSFPCNA